ncbi:hypothetical protein ACP4OV_025359 [Aristida adscensionis]
MAVREASPAVGHSAAAISRGAGDKAPVQDAGKEDAPPAEGGSGAEAEANGKAKGAAPPVERAPAASTVEGGDEGEEGEGAHGDDHAGEEEEEEGVKWMKHYSSAQSILVVGDGDFSFSLALATAFGSGAGLVATSLDTYEALRDKYCKAEPNIMKLKSLGAAVLHGIDVKTMKFHTDLKTRRFDRIVYNFPHAGFKGKECDMHMITLHKELVRRFFCSARHLVRLDGEIHVSHKTGKPYDKWDIEHLAAEFSLVLVEKASFQKGDYPGYNQKKGDGPNCDRPFKLGTCYTFKFRIGDLKKNKKRKRSRGRSTSTIRGNNIHPDKITDRRLFHLPPHVQGWPELHFPAAVNNTVCMPLVLQPEPYVVAQRQLPGFPLNYNGIVRAPYFHQQGNVGPVFSIPGPLLNPSLPSDGTLILQWEESLVPVSLDLRSSLGINMAPLLIRYEDITTLTSPRNTRGAY